MPNLTACDYANAAPIDIDAMARAGIIAVQRYLFATGKGITPDERKTLLGKGVGIAYGYEGYASNWRGGAKQGALDGQAALEQLRRLGITGTPLRVYFAIDEDAEGLGMLSTAKAYVVAAGEALAKGSRATSGPYGGAGVLDYIKRPGFQTYAWSGGRISKYAVLYQWKNGQSAFGGVVDYGEVRDAKNLGAEWPEDKNPAEEPNVSVFNIGLLRAVVLGKKYATKTRKKRWPRLVREEGVRAQADRIEREMSEFKKELPKLVAEAVKKAEHKAAPAHHAAPAKEADK